MQTVSAQLIANKKVLLRYDLDVPLGNGTGNRLQVTDDFRLKAGLETLKLCLEHGQEVILMGHIGRPEGSDPKYSVAPIYSWFKNNGFSKELESGKLKLLENLRFEAGEDRADPEYAKELAKYGDFFVNEAFGAYHEAASTTILPTLLSHAVGLHFNSEVEKLKKVRQNPHHPLVIIIGGAKVEEKKSFIEEMAKIADQVLVGGKIAQQWTVDSGQLSNVLVATLNSDGLDITEETIQAWKEIIKNAGMIVWNGPLGKVDSGQWTVDSLGSAKGTYEIAQAILESWAEVIVGGGDTVGFLAKVGLLSKFEQQAFVSVGGGAMLEYLSKGILPTIKALG